MNRHRWFCCRKYKEGFWFRFYGYGLNIYNRASFSDRHFKRKPFLGYYISKLLPEPDYE